MKDAHRSTLKRRGRSIDYSWFYISLLSPVGLGYAELRRGSRLPEFKCFASTPPMRQMHVRAEPLQRADRRCTGSGVASSTNPGASPARGHHCCQPINVIC